MSKIFDKFMKTKWKDMGKVLEKPGPVAPSHQPIENSYPQSLKPLKPGASIPVPPGTDFSKLLQPSLNDMAKAAQEQAAAQTFNNAFGSTTGVIGGGGGLSGYTSSSAGHSHYAQGIAVTSATYGDEMMYVEPSKQSMADPAVDAAINSVIERVKAQRENKADSKRLLDQCILNREGSLTKSQLMDMTPAESEIFNDMFHVTPTDYSMKADYKLKEEK